MASTHTSQHEPVQIRILQPSSAIRKVFATLCFAVFAFLLPFSWFIPVGQPFVSDVLPSYVTPGLFASDFGMAALVLSFLTWRRSPGYAGKGFYRLFLPLLSIPVLALIASPFALNPALSGYSAARWLLAVAVFLLVAYLDLPVSRLVTILLASLVGQAVTGVFQAAFQHPLGLPGEMTLALENHDAAAIYFSGTAWLRAYGLTFHPNVLGGYLLTGAILVIPWLKHKAGLLAFCFLLAGLFFTFSRSAWLAAGIVAPFLLWWYWRQYHQSRKRIVRVTAFTLVALTAFLIFFYPQVLTRMNPLSSRSEFSSMRARGELINISLTSIQSDPITGIGAGNFPIRMLEIKTLDDPHYVHNIPLLLASEIGLAGGLVWLFLWLMPVFRVETALHRKDVWPIVIVVAWFAWGLAGLWDSYPWALETGRLYTAALLALVFRVQPVEVENAR